MKNGLAVLSYVLSSMAGIFFVGGIVLLSGGSGHARTD